MGDELIPPDVREFILRHIDSIAHLEALLLLPLTQFSLLSRYQLTDQLAVGGTATYASEVYGGHLAANAANNHTVPWWRFDAFAEYEISKNWEIEVTGLNLTDELYYDAIYQAPNNPGTFAFVAPGRAGYLTVKWKYD